MKNKKKLTENGLHKALDDLEGALRKGSIPEEMKNPNGGLATEGEDLADEVSASEAKKSKKPKLSIVKGKKKAMDTSDEDESSDEEGSEDDDMSKAEGSSDEGAGDDDDEGVQKGGKKKVSKRYSASDASSEDDMSKADNSSNEGVRKSKKSKKVAKSFKQEAEEDDNLNKAMEVSGFLEGLVDRASDSIDEMRKSLVELGEYNQGFDNKLAKALIAIGKQVDSQGELLKSLVDRLEGTPDSSRMRKSMLSKSDVRPRFEGDTDDEEENNMKKADHADPRFRQKVTAVLLKKAMAKEIDPQYVTMYEAKLGGVPEEIITQATEEVVKSMSVSH